MLDSPSLRIAVRRDPPTVEDLRSTTVSDDPVQRRDLILLERARDGDLDAFNDLVTLYQDQLFALVVRMVPDRDQASDCRPGGVLLGVPQPDARSVAAASSRGSTGSASTPRWTPSGPASGGRSSPTPSSRTRAGSRRPAIEADPSGRRSLTERTRALAGALARDHRRPARRDRPVRRRGLRLRRDRRDDRRLARDRQVAHPSRPARAPRACSRTGWSCSVADRPRHRRTTTPTTIPS